MPISTANWEILSISEVKESVLSGLHKMVESVPSHCSALAKWIKEKTLNAEIKTCVEIFLIIFFILFIRIPGIDTMIRKNYSPPIRR